MRSVAAYLLAVGSALGRDRLAAKGFQSALKLFVNDVAGAVPSAVVYSSPLHSRRGRLTPGSR